MASLDHQILNKFQGNKLFKNIRWIYFQNPDYGLKDDEMKPSAYGNLPGESITVCHNSICKALVIACHKAGKQVGVWFPVTLRQDTLLFMYL